MASSVSSRLVSSNRARSLLSPIDIERTRCVQSHSATQPRRNADGTRMKENPKDTDLPELTDEQLNAMRPAREVMPPEFFETVKRKQGQRGPGKKPAKMFLLIRVRPPFGFSF